MNETAQTHEALWMERAEMLTEDALGAIRSGDNPDEAIGALSAAAAALKIALGELPADELLSWFPEDDDEGDCTCTPEQRAAGGFRGSCPVHGSGGRARR